MPRKAAKLSLEAYVVGLYAIIIDTNVCDLAGQDKECGGVAGLQASRRTKPALSEPFVGQKAYRRAVRTMVELKNEVSGGSAAKPSVPIYLHYAPALLRVRTAHDKSKKGWLEWRTVASTYYFL